MRYEQSNPWTNDEEGADRKTVFAPINRDSVSWSLKIIIVTINDAPNFPPFSEYVYIIHKNNNNKQLPVITRLIVHNKPYMIHVLFTYPFPNKIANIKLQ